MTDTNPPQRPDLTAMIKARDAMPISVTMDERRAWSWYTVYYKTIRDLLDAAIAEQTAPVEPQAGDDRADALAAIPDLVGTPATSAYARSNEKAAIWLGKYYKTIRAALSAFPKGHSNPP